VSSKIIFVLFSNCWITIHFAALTDNGKFLLAARKCRRATCTDFLISLDADDMSKGSGTYIGKLRYVKLHPYIDCNPLWHKDSSGCYKFWYL